MAKDVVLKLQINGVDTSIKNIGELETHLKQLKKDIKGVDIASDAFNKMQGEIKQTDAKLKELNAGMKNHSGTLSKLPQMTANLVAGYAAVAGAIAGVINLAKESIGEFLAADKVQQQVNQTFGDYSDEITKSANAFEKATAIEAEKYMELSIAAKAYGASNQETNEIVNEAIGLAKQFELNGVSQEYALKALVKAQNGQFAALEKIYPALKQVTDESEKLRIVNELSEQGWEKLNAYTETYSGQIDLVEHSIGNLKEVGGQQIIQSILGEPEEIDKATKVIDDIVSAIEETGFLKEYIQQAIYPLTTLFTALEDIFSLFEGENDVNTFKILLDTWMFAIKRVTLPINVLWAALGSLVKLLTGDVDGALKAILKPFQDLLEPVVSLGQELGIISDSFSLMEEEATGSIKKVEDAIIDFGGTAAEQYKKTGTSQEELLEASKIFSETFIGLTEDEKKAIQELTFAYRQGVQDRISSYIDEVGLFNSADKVRLQWLSDTLKEMKSNYEKDLEEFKKSNEEKVDDTKKTTKEIKDIVSDFTINLDKELKDLSPIKGIDNILYDPGELEEEATELLDFTLSLKEKIAVIWNTTESVGGAQGLTKSLIMDAFELKDNEAEDLINKAVETAGSILGGIRQIQDQNMSAEMSQLDAYYQQKLKLAEGNEQQISQIEKAYAIEKAKLEDKQRRIKKRQAISDAVINGALSITDIWAEHGGNPIVAGILTGLSAVMLTTQLAVINNQKYARGGILKGPSHANGGILTPYGELEGGEAVVNKRTMSNPNLANLVSYANMAGGGVPLTNSMQPFIDYDLLASKINDKKVYVIDRDITNRQNKSAKILDRAKF